MALGRNSDKKIPPTLNNGKHVLKRYLHICSLSLQTPANTREIHAVFLSCSNSWFLLSVSSMSRSSLLTTLSGTHLGCAPSAVLSTQANPSNYICWTRIFQASQKSCSGYGGDASEPHSSFHPSNMPLRLDPQKEDSWIWTCQFWAVIIKAHCSAITLLRDSSKSTGT